MRAIALSERPLVSIDEHGEIALPWGPSRDLPLTLRTRVSPDILEKLGVAPPTEGIMNAMLGILGALGQADDRWVSYSRRKQWYVGQQSVYGRWFTYTNVVRAVDLLDAHRCIDHYRAKPGTTSKWQSRMRARPELLAVLRDRSTAYNCEPAPLIIIRDSDKRSMDVPNNRDVAAMRPKLEKLREVEDAIRLELQNAERVGHHVVVGGSKIALANLSNPSLSRVFSRGSTRHNGRRHAAGGGYQSLPSAYRQQLELNGEHVASADFRAAHIALLYARIGAVPPADPYIIDGLTRDQAKLALLVAINASTRHAAIGAIRRHFRQFSYERAAAAFAAVCAAHVPIAGFFGSDAGIELMREESDIVINAALDCARRGIPTLAVHDELIAPANRIGQVAEAMERAANGKIVVRVTEACPSCVAPSV